MQKAGFAAALGLIGLLVTACGNDEPNQAPETVLPERPEDKLIDETGRPEERTSDPTPETGTGGKIPGYDPAD